MFDSFVKNIYKYIGSLKLETTSEQVEMKVLANNKMNKKVLGSTINVGNDISFQA